jgi:5-(carboxyamino)imidazole ribonucleotide synthase
MSTPVIHPPSCVVGVMGGGQLGRMLALAARRIGVRTAVWTGGLEAPAVEVADEVIDAPFDDPCALERFVSVATVATIEFENIPWDSLERVADRIPLHPSPHAVSICQNRGREKDFLVQNGIPCAWFRLVSSAEELAVAMAELGGAGVLKTADFGYDGRGQIKLEGDEDPADVWSRFDAPSAVLEAWVPFVREISVMVARDVNGHCVCYDPAENRHRSHILDLSIVPARIDPEQSQQAQSIACRIADALSYCGIMGVEFFVAADGSLLVNEMAPRPHNSGHHTIDACETSQFEQQLRMVLGLSAGSPRLHTPVVMLNLLGDMWPHETTPPDWSPLFADPRAHLHLYGKHRAKGRRKMGHANILGDSVEAALDRAEALKELLLQRAI